MSKLFKKLTGNITKGVDIERVMNFLIEDAEAMIGREASEYTEQVIVEITVKEVKDVV